MSINVVFANNVQTTLQSALTPTATSVTLTSAANLPTLSGGQVMLLTLNDASTQNLYEVCYVTAILGNVLTVTRAQEGTTALNWAAGDLAYSCPTAACLQAMVQEGNPGIQTMLGQLAIGGTSSTIGNTYGAGVEIGLCVGTNASTGGISLGLGTTAQAAAIYAFSGSLFLTPPFSSTSQGTANFGPNGMNILGEITPGIPGSATPGGASILGGTGTPNGVVTAMNGSIFVRADGTTGARVYVNQSGVSTSGTAWAAISGI